MVEKASSEEGKTKVWSASVSLSFVYTDVRIGFRLLTLSVSPPSHLPHDQKQQSSLFHLLVHCKAVTAQLDSVAHLNTSTTDRRPDSAFGTVFLGLEESKLFLTRPTNLGIDVELRL